MIQGIHSLSSIPTIRFILKAAEKKILYNDLSIFRACNGTALDDLKNKVLKHVKDRDESTFDEAALFAKISKNSDITSLEWAELCKQLVQKGKYWKPTFHLCASRQLLFAQWRNSQGDLKAQALSFLNFLGQLDKDGFGEIVSVFHNYLRLLRKANLFVIRADNQGQYEGFNVKGLAKITGPIFFDAMDFKLCIFEQEQSEHYTSAHKKECLFLADLANEFFTNDFFDQVYSQKTYKNFSQNAEELLSYEQVVESSFFSSPVFVHTMAKQIDEKLNKEITELKTSSNSNTSSTSEEALSKTSSKKSKKSFSKFFSGNKKEKDKESTGILDTINESPAIVDIDEFEGSDEQKKPSFTVRFSSLRIASADLRLKDHDRLDAPRGEEPTLMGVQALMTTGDTSKTTIDKKAF